MNEETEPSNQAIVRWAGEGLTFTATIPGNHDVVVDEPAPLSGDRGGRPTDLLLAAVASCSGISAISLLQKMRQPVRSLTVRAGGERQQDWPRAFTSIGLGFDVSVSPGWSNELIHKAVDLAVRRYCPVSATIELGEGGCSVAYEVMIHQDSE